MGIKDSRHFLFVLSLLFFSSFVSAYFIRGDANQDSNVDISDSIFISNYLFKSGEEPQCMDAADVNDDGRVDISDSIYLDNFLFKSGPAPPAPYPSEGTDPTADELDCGGIGKGATCQGQWGICNNGIMETDEGPGGQYCCSGSAPSGYEECYDYFTKSTAYIPPYKSEPAAQATDGCLNNEILVEVAIDCNSGQDVLLFEQKDCNDFNEKGDWIYFCEGKSVLRKRKYYDYGCKEGACKIISVYDVDLQVVSKSGDSSYCYDKVKYCGTQCEWGESDCDSDGECVAGLKCLGSSIFDTDGCCKPGQVWDDSKLKCLDCSPNSGPCCDSNGNFRDNNYACKTNIGPIEYACENNCLGDDVLKRTKTQYCSGSSKDCNGGIQYSISEEESCLSSEYCSGSTSWTTTLDGRTCKTAKCTFGPCCDARCGVYNYKSSDYVCDSFTEEGCPWGTNIGNDAGKRTVKQFCSGSSAECTGAKSIGDWTVKEDCKNCPGASFCSLIGSSASCKKIQCCSASECGTDGFIDEPFCKNNDVWDKYRTWSCNNAGTKDSTCSSSLQDKKIEECGDDSFGSPRCSGNNLVRDVTERYCSSATCQSDTRTEIIKACTQGCDSTKNICNEDKIGTCSDKIKNQDETDVDCGGTKCPKCALGKSCLINSDCNSAYCNPSTLKCDNPPCVNECTAGTTRCKDSNTMQTCGNYDADSCTEWGNDVACVYGCSGTSCAQNLPDLRVSYFVLQYPTTPKVNDNVTLAFKIENIGKTSASGIYWKLYTGEGTNYKTNSVGLNIDALKNTMVYTKVKYTKAGTYTAKVVVDYDNKIKEIDEGNNERTLSIKIS